MIALNLDPSRNKPNRIDLFTKLFYYTHKIYIYFIKLITIFQISIKYKMVDYNGGRINL